MLGPIHLLELQMAIGLTGNQAQRIEVLYRVMKARAMTPGARLIELERGLNDSFANGPVTRNVLDARLSKIAAVRKALRLTHLEMNLHTSALLTRQQIAAYNRFRGYTAAGDHDSSRHHGHGRSGG